MDRSQNFRNLIESLAGQETGKPVVSLYMPAALEFDERDQNDIRLKNLLREATQQLEGMGVDAREIDELLQPVREANIPNRIWKEHRRGFAVFAAEGMLQCIGLPYDVRELALASARFHVKPLFEGLARSGSYYVLALSLNDVGLYLGSSSDLTRVELGDEIPTSLTDVTGRELTEEQLQYHTGNPGNESAIYHGQGGGKDDTDADIERFLRAVDDALAPYWQESGATVVLAGVERLLAAYRKVSAHEEVLEGAVTGNVEHLSPEELHEKAWALVKDDLHERRQKALADLEPGGDDDAVCNELTDVVIAAADGRVDSLVIAADAECWGRYDTEERNIAIRDEAEPGDYDLLDRAAAESYLKGGNVWVLPSRDIPNSAVSMARLRY